MLVSSLVVKKYVRCKHYRDVQRVHLSMAFRSLDYLGERQDKKLKIVLKWLLQLAQHGARCAEVVNGLAQLQG